jgi:hypothetical protein
MKMGAGLPGHTASNPRIRRRARPRSRIHAVHICYGYSRSPVLCGYIEAIPINACNWQ